MKELVKLFWMLLRYRQFPLSIDPSLIFGHAKSRDSELVILFSYTSLGVRLSKELFANGKFDDEALYNRLRASLFLAKS